MGGLRVMWHSGLNTKRNSNCFFLMIVLALPSFSLAQLPYPTSRGDNARDGANTQETVLTLSNVNVNSFGHLFRVPIDYVALAQPLYMPKVKFPTQGTHNVVYVATQADSVYAFDADNGAKLWSVNFTNPAQGITTAQLADHTLPCGPGGGFVQEGIPGTPVIDPTSNTLYLVVKTVVKGAVELNLHALDITTGDDKAGSPVLIEAQSISKKGNVVNFDAFYEKNRPGLLLSNGNVYLGFGSNGCNDHDTGWILAYNASSLTQVAVFNTSPDYGLVSVWQTGNGLAADSEGNLFVATAESGANRYDVPEGGQTYCNSVVKLSPTLEVLDYFTPYDITFLNTEDLDLSAGGVMLLGEQTGPYPDELVAAGKQGVVYVLNRDNLGMYSANDSGALQEFPLIAGQSGNSTNAVLFSSPAYWNEMVYYAPDGQTPTVYPVSGGVLGNPLPSPGYASAHSPSVSANGNSDGILWVISGPGDAKNPELVAFNAVTQQELYDTRQAPNNRDVMPAVGHFITQTVANGKVYVATQTTLEAFGLLNLASVTGGSGQSAKVGTPLPAPIQVRASNPYTGQVIAGVTLTFSDGCKKAGGSTCGTFNPASAVTDANGDASTIYTVPKTAGTYTVSVSGTGLGIGTATETATPGTPVKLVASKGARQSGAAGSKLANPIVAKIQDTYGNGVAGITVNFAADDGAIPNPTTVVTDGNGLANTILQLPTGVAKITVTASASGFKSVTYVEYSDAGPAASIATTGGNDQSGRAGTQLPEALTVLVADQYGNPVSDNNVTFSDGGAGGTFSHSNPVTTGANGIASQMYTLPASPKAVTITATAMGVTSPAVFTETGQSVKESPIVRRSWVLIPTIDQ
jgi:hypothetical protein